MTYVAVPDFIDTWKNCERRPEKRIKRQTHSASISVAAKVITVLSIFISAGAIDITNDFNGPIISVFSGGLILEDAQPCDAICIIRLDE